MPNQSPFTIAGLTGSTDLLDWSAKDHALHSWSFRPEAISTGTAATAGTVQLIRVKVHSGVTLSTITLSFTTGGSGLTNCYAGIYSSAGALLGVSAERSANWASSGLKTATFTPVVVSDDYVWVALLNNGTTGPAYSRGANNGAVNAGLTTPRFASADTGVTTLPATLGTITATTTAYWVAVS